MEQLFKFVEEDPKNILNAKQRFNLPKKVVKEVKKPSPPKVRKQVFKTGSNLSVNPYLLKTTASLSPKSDRNDYENSLFFGKAPAKRTRAYSSLGKSQKEFKYDLKYKEG